MKPKVLQNITIYSEEGVLKKANLVIKNKKIFSYSEKKISQEDAHIFSFPTNYSLIPGFIDLHIHGGYGVDIMDADLSALKTLCKKLPEEGTTSFLATTVSQEKENIEKALIATASYMQKDLSYGAEILGIHLEGPFLCKKKCGAHLPNWILDPDINLMKKWIDLSSNQIKIVTLAPEKKGAFDFITLCKHQNILPSIGHTSASYELALKAIDHGCNYATHLFNAMDPLHHRHPSAALACLLHPNVTVELIADLIHVHPAMLDMVYKLKTAQHITLITDSMRAKALGEGTSDLGGQEVIVKNNNATLKDQTLAGSVLKMIDAFKNFFSITENNMEKLIEMTSYNPAKLLNIFEKKGSIKKDKDADLVVLDEKLNVIMTFCKGEVVYQKS